jgi:IS6 family transposase
VSIVSGRHFPKDVILWAVRWYCRYGVSYRDLEEMLTERGVPVDHVKPCSYGTRRLGKTRSRQ